MTWPYKQKQIPSGPKGPESSAVQDPAMADLVRALGFDMKDLRGLVHEQINIFKCMHAPNLLFICMKNR